MRTPADALASATIAHHSKSFALASRLLPPAIRRDAVVLYAWCRYADDAIDEAPSHAYAMDALARLRAELASLYRREPQRDAVLAALQDVLERRQIPQLYPEELLAGMQMDLDGARYADRAALQLYCWRVAGVVGLMMCHVMGVADARALRPAAQLGLAMQLTNICRDVAEDWQRDRLYLPDDVLDGHGLRGLHNHLGQPLPVDAAARLPGAIQTLLAEADGYYLAGRQGLLELPWRCALAIAVAAAVYADIGRALAHQELDPLRGRAHTTSGRKLWLVLCATLGQLATVPQRLRRHSRAFRPPHGARQLSEVL